MSWKRRIVAGVALGAYVWALLGAYALHDPLCNHAGCSVAHVHVHPHEHAHGGHHHDHAHTHSHNHSGSDHHHSDAPASQHDSDDCAWCQFLALSAWNQPALAAISIETAADTLPPAVWTKPAPRQAPLPPVRGPPTA